MVNLLFSVLGTSGSIKANIFFIIPHDNPANENRKQLTPMSIRNLFIMLNNDACTHPSNLDTAGQWRYGSGLLGQEMRTLFTNVPNTTNVYDDSS
jgi:hypothetical protein